MIEIRNLTKSFGTLYALRGIHLSIPGGIFLSIFGPNGAGKTTFIRILATLSKASGGEVLFDGRNLNDSPEKIRRHIGVIGHSTFLYDELTAYENLKFYCTLYEVEDAASRIDHVLTEVGLANRRNDFVRTFSRGMQQRLSIARAMLHEPDILLLDEPYTGLDQHAAQMLTQWLSKLKSQKRTIVLVTHDIHSGLELADRVAIFVRGKVAFEADRSQISPDSFRKTYYDIVAGGGTS